MVPHAQDERDSYATPTAICASRQGRRDVMGTVELRLFVVVALAVPLGWLLAWLLARWLDPPRRRGGEA